MNLLKLQLGEPISTKKLSLQGVKKVFDVYRIPIDQLVYNKKNGRIATYVSEFIDEGNNFPQNDIEAFNNIIEKYIEQSNPEALKKTKANIRVMSQTEPAVVLSNGVILDGNRRFTSLRQLTREIGGAEFAFLEAVILDESLYKEKDIKRLELNLQHAYESRVDYNPIDRLVDIYRDLISDTSQFTPLEYARETQSSVKKINEEIEVARLMIEYLEFIGQPLKFFIARNQKIDGPIREVRKILKSSKIDGNRIDDIKEFLFLNILSLEGDISRRVRDLKSVFEDRQLSTRLLDKIEESEILEDANDFFEDGQNKESFKENHVVTLDMTIRESTQKMTEDFVEKKKLLNAKNQSIEVLNRVYSLISEVDKEEITRLDDRRQEELSTLVLKIIEKLELLRD